jgi:hypothetical protein
VRAFPQTAFWDDIKNEQDQFHWIWICSCHLFREPIGCSVRALRHTDKSPFRIRSR